MWSEIVTPTGVTSSGPVPVERISPPAAWPARSAPLRLVAEPPALQRAGQEVGDHHVGGVHQAQEDVAPLLDPQVERDAALAAVAADQVGRPQVLERDRDPARLIADPGQLDLDHVGAEIAQQLSRLGPLHQETQIEHADPLECAPRAGDVHARS
jgi:hypothetical protein